MIQISNEKCVGCGSCQKVCPMAVISINEKKAVTVHEDCIDCGHCQGICPTAAITMNQIEETLRDAKREVAFPDLQNLIESNRSIRIFKDQEVSASDISALLRTLDYSPSGKMNNLCDGLWYLAKTKWKRFPIFVPEIYHPNILFTTILQHFVIQLQSVRLIF